MGKLGQLLVARGWITVQQLTRALQNQNGVGGRLGTCLLEMDVLGEDLLARSLAEQQGVPAAGIEELRAIPDEVLHLIPEKLARRCRAIPFRVAGGRLDVAMQDPRNLVCQDEIAFACGRRVKVHVLHELRIYEALQRYYKEECPSRYSLLLDRLNRARYLWAGADRGRAEEPAEPHAEVLRALNTDDLLSAPPRFAPPPLPEPTLPPLPPSPRRRSLFRSRSGAHEAPPSTPAAEMLPPLEELDLRARPKRPRATEPRPLLPEEEGADSAAGTAAWTAGTAASTAGTAAWTAGAPAAAVRPTAAPAAGTDAYTFAAPGGVFEPAPAAGNTTAPAAAAAAAPAAGVFAAPAATAAPARAAGGAAASAATETVAPTRDQRAAGEGAATPQGAATAAGERAAAQPADSAASPAGGTGAEPGTAAVAPAPPAVAPAPPAVAPAPPAVAPAAAGGAEAAPAVAASAVAGGGATGAHRVVDLETTMVVGPRPRPRPATGEMVKIVLSEEERNQLGVDGGPATAPPAAAPASLDEVEAALAAAADSEEIGRIVLGWLARKFRRAALFQATRQGVSGWMAAGEGVDEEAFAHYQASFDEPSVFLNLARGSSIHMGPMPPMKAHRDLALCWGGGLPRDCLLLPVRLKERMVIAFYVDGAASFDMPEMQRLQAAAATAFGRRILRKKHGYAQS